MLNLIRIRYLDAPVFMDVASVISKYELLSLLRRIQQVDGIRLRNRFIDNKQTVVMYFREPQTDETARRFKTGFKSSGLEFG
jgi:hypothetical protein